MWTITSRIAGLAFGCGLPRTISGYHLPKAAFRPHCILFKSTMPPKYKLIYYDIKWLAEPIRWIFLQAGQEFEDFRFKDDDWAEIKPKTPMGQVPILEIDGRQMAQTKAICRYLATKYDLVGATDMEQAHGDMIVDYTDDMRKKLAPIHFEQDKDKQKQMVLSYCKEELPVYMANFEKLLLQNNGGNGFFVGNKVTWTDFYFVNFMCLIIEVLAPLGGIVDLSRFPKLRALLARVQALPAIADWIKTRPATLL